jgi:phenylpropionate dioxygenase-like ring-hydroxylating dioxygenase large terminal subunit
MSKATAERRAAPVVAASEESWSLPAWTYSDPDFMELERRRVFLPAWHLVCHLNDIPRPGDWRGFKLYGEHAFVVRGKDGGVRAFHNVCRHRAARLLDGDHGNCGSRIVCPYHAWTFQLDGRLTGVPFLDQYETFDRADFGLTPVEVESFAGLVFIRFAPDGASLTEYLAPIAEELALYRVAEMQPLRAAGERIREVNWKNAIDNYVDALHIAVAHDGLHGLLGKSYRLAIDRGVHKIFSEIQDGPMAAPSNRAYAMFLPEAEHLPPERRRMWTYWKLWPSLMFDVYPDQVDFMQFIPLSPTVCVLRESAYALPDDRREMKAARYLNIRINRSVNREDRGLIERVQAGMASSSFKAGPLGKSEICIRHFAQQMREAIPLARSREKPSRAAVDAALGE